MSKDTMSNKLKESTMIVVKNNEETVKFDNGLVLSSDFTPDCCAVNYLDFEQLHVGREFKHMTAQEFLDAITIKEDGFIIKDKSGVPAWVQARSMQNGYYSAGVDLVAEFEGETVRTGKKEFYGYDEQFQGELE